MSRLRLLHVSWGFTPWLGGGLVAYVEGLMEAQAAAGHDVAFFGAARHLPLHRRPMMRRWERRGVTMHELFNSPLPQHWSAGTLRPDRDLQEPWTEQAFARVLARHRPDVVHVQHLAGVPSSLLGMARDAGCRVVVTLQDYLPLCPTFKLLDADGSLCVGHDVGAMCARCCAGAPADAGHLVNLTVRNELTRLRVATPGLRDHELARVGPIAGALVDRARWRTPERGMPAAAPRPAPPEAYQRRRDENVSRLASADLLVAQSPRLAEMYLERGVAAPLRSVRHTLPHIERLTPRRRGGPPERLTFAVINAFQSPAKGARVLLDALHRLRDQHPSGSFRLLALGYVADDLRPELEAFDEVELAGPYAAAELDALLDPVDVGLVPSIWEEAFGYVGLEMLAKGIPVIGSALGGIIDYVRDGQTGWLNRSAGAAELAALMGAAIDRPDEVLRMRERVLALRGELIVPMATHLAEIERLYSEVLERAPEPLMR